MLYVEFGICDLFLTTFKLHVDYIIKVLNMKDSRIPKKIVKFAFQSRSLWFKDWIELAESVNSEFTIDANNIANLKRDMIEVCNKFHYKNLIDAKRSAKSSLHREIYSKLNHDILQLHQSYLHLPPNLVSIIFKTRGELLPLNFIPHRNDLQIYCSLCNSNTRENLFHFIGKCPMLSETRRFYFECSALSETLILEFLNGKNWSKLIYFIKEALNYRRKIIDELF